MRQFRTVILLLSFTATLVAACGDEAFEDSWSDETTEAEAVESASDVSPQPAERTGDLAEWTVLLYQDADDEILEQDILIDFNEAERVGSTAEVNIVSQIDRYWGGYDGMDDWTTTKRFYVTQDDDLDWIGSEELDDLGEVNMADGQSLVDFIVWAAENFPAKRYALILSDHGAGWPGGFNDPDPGGLGDHDVYVAEMFGGDGIWLMELDQALEDARATAGIEQFELIGFDACLMGQLEVFVAAAPHGRFAVASQELEPSVGWAYTSLLGELVTRPTMDGAELSKTIVSSYIDQDQRILDEAARLEMEPEAGSAEELAQALGVDITLTAVDLSLVPEVGNALDELVAALLEADQELVAEARAYAQPFESVFGEDEPSPYIDLGHFAQLLTEFDSSPEVSDAADGLFAAMDRAILAEKHGPDRPGATGIAIYFPTGELFDAYDNQGYTTVAERFAREHRWDDFLQFHYTGEIGEGPATRSRSPGAEPIVIDPLTLSSDTADLDHPVLIQTEITGRHIGYVYSFFGRYDEALDALIVEDQDYLFSDETREVGGVAYPVWGDEGLIVDFEWAPVVYAINDGTSSVKALFQPDQYGDSPVYVVEGRYVFAGGSAPRYARMYFQDGEMTKVFGFTGTDGSGAPREITPRPGDQFVVFEQGIDLDESAPEETFWLDGGTLTFGSARFFIEEIPAPAGTYVVGFIIEDFAGNTYEQYDVVEVIEP